MRALAISPSWLFCFFCLDFIPNHQCADELCLFIIDTICVCKIVIVYFNDASFFTGYWLQTIKCYRVPCALWELHRSRQLSWDFATRSDPHSPAGGEKAGAKLFIRSQRRVALTPAGEEFLPFAEHMVGELIKQAELIQTKQGLPETKLNIACLMSISHVVLPRALVEFRRRIHKLISKFERDLERL